MGRRKQFRPKKAENSNDSEDGGVVEDQLKSSPSNNGGVTSSLPSSTPTSPPPPPPPPNPSLMSLPPHHPTPPTPTLGILSPWLSELKGPEGMAARLLQLQRLAMQYSNSGACAANGKVSSQMDPLDLSSKLPFPWSLPPPPPPPQPLWNPGWFLNAKGGPHLRSSPLKSQQQQQQQQQQQLQPCSLGKESSSSSPLGGGPVKDIFRCVWCTESYSTLDELTQHLVEAKHNTSNLPRCESPIVSKASLPRKLVRGQDVWLGKGQEQTREILKCMWCGQSFKSLADLTLHMQETKHYTKVISQEQITSWKQQQGDPSSSSNNNNNNNNAGAPSPPKPPLNSPPVSNNNNNNNSSSSSCSSNSNSGNPNPNIGASHQQQCLNSSASNGGAGLAEILTCKVCDEPCSSLKELTSHMARNNHYKSEPRSPTKRLRDSSSPPPLVLKEKRKKSLPVRKLLELERIKSEPISSSPTSSTNSSSSNSCSPPKKSRLPLDEENSGSILGSLEQMVETSFKSGGGCHANNRKGGGGSGGLLSRLGIDEEKSEEEPAVHFMNSSRIYPKFLSSFLNNNHHNHNNNNAVNNNNNNNNSLRSNSASLEESLLSLKKSNALNDERLSSSSSSSSPLPLRCSLCSDEFGDKENFADHFERKHANFMLNSLSAKGVGGALHSFDSAHTPPPPISLSSSYNSNNNSSNSNNNNNSGSNASSGVVNEESSESKFLKYSELAKQLSGR